MRDAALRPFGFGDLLDAAFTLYRRNFFTFLGIALVPQLPVALGWLLLSTMAPPADPAQLTAANALLVPINLMIHVWLWAALTSACWTAYAGESPLLGGSLRHGLQRWPAAAGAFVVAVLLFTLGFMLLIIPGLILAPMFFAVFAAAVIEERGALAALGRSRRLSQGARLRIVALLLVAWIITLLPSGAMWAIAGVWFGPPWLGGGSALTQNAWVLVLSNTGGVLLGALTVPFLVGVMVLLYVDRRARTEAPDLESAVASLRREH